MDETAREILIRSGKWELDRSVIIPKGYKVIARAGTLLNLSNSATILTYSPVELIGSEENPIVIQSLDATGQGLVIMNAKQPLKDTKI